MPNYLDVVYNKEKRPYTDYPSQLCSHLAEEFGMKKGQRLLDIGCGRGDFTKGFKGSKNLRRKLQNVKTWEEIEKVVKEIGSISDEF